MKKYSVLCYIINGYEIVHEIREKDDDCEYILVTDDDNLKSSTWNVIVDHDLDGMTTFQKCYSIRFNPFKYCLTDVCIYLDASIGILKSLRLLYDSFMNSGSDIGLMIHPWRGNLKQELEEWVRTRKYPIEQRNRTIELFNKIKYDYSIDTMFQGCLSIKRKQFQYIDSITYDYLMINGINNDIDRLDQVIYSAIVTKYFSNLKIFPISNQVVFSKYMEWYQHHSNVFCTSPSIFYNGKHKIKNVFGKPTECFEMY